MNVLHGGGQIFPNDQDPNVKLIAYWISHPVPLGQDEFSATAYGISAAVDSPRPRPVRRPLANWPSGQAPA